MSTLRFFMLGPIQFRRDEEVIPLRAAKAIALLAYLALVEAPQRREVLADLLWPHSLPQASQKNLSNTLWRLRKRLGDVVVKRDTHGLMLADGLWSDSQQFETSVESLLREDSPTIKALQAPIQLYRGPLLNGLTLWNAPDFEMWLRTEQMRFSELYLRAIEMLVAAHRIRGNWQAIIPLARQAITYDHVRESMVQALMEAQAQLGERRAALHDYDTLRTALQSELNINPLPQTEALYQAILRGAIPNPDNRDNPEAPALESSSVPSKFPPHQAPRPSPPGSHTPFVGRNTELSILDDLLELAAERQARVVLLTGELGIGKSRLWQTWSARVALRPSFPTTPVILQTRCLDTAQSLPFAPLMRLFRQSIYVERLFKPPSPLSPIWLAELAHLLPEIRQKLPEIPARLTLPAEEQRLRLFEAFTQALQALEAHPLILFIDDLHWADQATLDCLLYFVDRMRHESLLLVAAYRPRDASARLVQQIANWHREAVVRQLPIPHLTLEEAAELLIAQDDNRINDGVNSRGNRVTNGMRDDRSLAAQLYAQSAGNPYFLLELHRAPAGETPPALAKLVQTRLNRLPKGARHLLQAAAVLETEIDFDTLRCTSGRNEEETLNALDLLVEEDFLVERGHGYEFVHPLVSRIVHHDLSVARRRILHRRAADALQAIHTGHETAVVGRLAAHYAEAGRSAQAAKYAELAAERAMALAAPSEAVAFYRQAISILPTPARHMGLGQALFDQGLLNEARQAWQDAAAAFESVGRGDKTGVARAYGMIAGSYMASGEGKEVVQWAERALLAAEKESEPAVIAQAHIFLTSGTLLLERSFTTAEHHLTQAVYIATDNDLPEIAAQGQLMLGNLLAEKGDLHQALQAYKAGISLVQASGNHYIEVFAHNNVAYHAMLTDDLAKAHKHIDIGLALIEEHLLASPRQFLYCTRGEMALAEGALDEAESWLNHALGEAQNSRNQLQTANIHAKLGLVARERSDFDMALTFLTNAHNALTTPGATHLQTQIDLWLAELYIERGEQSRAEDALCRAEERLRDSERKGLQAWASRVRATVS